MTTLIISADDYGYRPAYDAGILEAARAGAVDAVSAFSLPPGLDPEPLIETGVEIGLHLDLASGAEAPRATDEDRVQAAAEIWRQLERFISRFGDRPAYLDGHHHSHARDGIGVVISDIAVSLELPVRSINPRHRRLLGCRGVATPDLLIGRTSESEAALPPELASDQLPEGVIEWMVHPGRRDPRSESSFDAGREEDLELLLRFQVPAGVQRSTHRKALLGAGLARGANACEGPE